MARRFAKLEFAAAAHAPHEAQTLQPAPDHHAVRYLAEAQAAQRWGRFDEALRLFTRALHEERTLVIAWVGQVQMLVQLDECHEARVWSDKALQLFRNQPDLLAAQAQALARLHDLPAALARSDAALQAGDTGPWPWQVRGEVLLARKQRCADDCFQKALQLPAADWFDRVLVAGIYQYYGRLTNALHYLNRDYSPTS